MNQLKKTIITFIFLFLATFGLQAQFEMELSQTIMDPAFFIESVNFSPDGVFFASGSRDNTVKIYKKSYDSFELTQTINEHDWGVWSARFSADGNFLASASWDKTVRIYQKDGDEFNFIQVLADHNKPVFDVAFSLDGNYLASASKDNTVKIYKKSGNSFALVQSLEDHSDEVRSVSFSPDGRFLVSGARDNTINIYEKTGGNFEYIQDFDCENWVESVNFSPDGTYFTVGAWGAKIKIYKKNGNSFELAQTLYDNSVSVNSTNFSPDGKFLAAASFGMVNIYEKKGNSFNLIETILDHSLQYEVRSVAFSEDGNFFASGSRDNFVQVYNLNGVGGNDFTIVPYDDNNTNNNTNNDNNNNTQENVSNLPPILLIDKIKVSENVLRAGESINISVTVNNIGQGDATGVFATLSTNMDYALSYDYKTFFYDIDKTSGSQTITIPITAKENIASSQLQINVRVTEPNVGMEIEGKRILISTQRLKRPELKLARYNPKEIISSSPNNQIDINEQIGFEIYIQNVGEGLAENVKVEISNSQNGVMFLGYAIGEGKPNNTIPNFNIDAGKYKVVTAQYFINSSFTADEIKLEVNVSEAKGKYGFIQYETTAVNSTLTAQGEVETVERPDNNNNTDVVIENLPEATDNLIKDLPQNPTNENRFALIIGNEDYKDLIAVDYALNDSRAFRIYAEKVLGVPADHIIYKENVGVTDFNTIINKSSNLMNSNRELFVYYSGHGFPTKNGETFLMPVDVNEDNVGSYGIKLKDFYDKLSKNNPARVTVFIDACFSGGGRNGLSIARSGIKLKPKETDLSQNIVSFTASTGDEVAQKYDKQQHGLFTYYLLKTLKDTKGDINYSNFATKLQTEVKDRSNIEDKLKEQNPKISIGSGATDWENWRIK